jgi:hypothetical protein
LKADERSLYKSGSPFARAVNVFGRDPRWLSKIDETTAAGWKMKARDDLKPYLWRKLRNRSAVSRTACKTGEVT